MPYIDKVSLDGTVYDVYDTDLRETVADELDNLKSYVTEMSPLISTGPAALLSVPDAAPLPAEGAVVHIVPAQSGSGTPSPENVRPITGFTGATVRRTGKNIMSVGSLAVGGSETRTKRIKIDPIPAGEYSVSFNNIGTSTSGFGIQFFDTVSLGHNVGSVSAQQKLVLSDTAVSVYLYMSQESYNNGLTVILNNIQIEPGSVATAYEPYQGDTYTVAFPSAAGTVYGGYIDLTNGKLTVDRAMKTFTGDAGENWDYYSISSGNLFRTTISDRQQGPIAQNTANINMFMSNAYKPAADRTSGRISGTFSSSSDNDIVDFVNDDFDTVNDWTTHLANNPLQFVYPLATPVTYQLTPQEIALLRGANVIFADCGNTTLTYRQDVAALLKALTTPDESDMRANTNYAVNSFFMVGGTLFRATAAIATGETITPGTNCVATTISEQLTYLYSQI